MSILLKCKHPFKDDRAGNVDRFPEDDFELKGPLLYIPNNGEVVIDVLNA